MPMYSLAAIARRSFARALAAAIVVAGVACGSDNNTTAPTVQTTRSYNQVQRLGNPLLSEVFLAKKDHPFHGSTGPSDDVANAAASVKGFVAAFRPQATSLQNTLATVLLPDMLIVQTDKAGNTAGWL